MKLKLLSAALLMLSSPIAFAAPDHKGGENGKGQAQPQPQGGPRAQPAPQAGGRAGGQMHKPPAPAAQDQGRRQGPVARSGPVLPQAESNQAQRKRQDQAAGPGGAAPQPAMGRQIQRVQGKRGTATQPRAGLQATRPSEAMSPAPANRAGAGNRAANHVQQRSQWSAGHADRNRNTVWQGNRNWWRGNTGFGGYTGARLNFYFAPKFGYYQVPLQYRGRTWQTGAYLPLFFLRYEVDDYQAYGLPAPPYGYSWVWVNNAVFLIDRSDGYILDEIANVW